MPEIGGESESESRGGVGAGCVGDLWVQGSVHVGFGVSLEKRTGIEDTVQVGRRGRGVQIRIWGVEIDHHLGVSGLEHELRFTVWSFEILLPGLRIGEILVQALRFLRLAQAVVIFSVGLRAGIREIWKQGLVGLREMLSEFGGILGDLVVLRVVDEVPPGPVSGLNTAVRE